MEEKNMEMFKLSDKDISNALSHKNPTQLRQEMEALQVAVYTMIGGGWIGQFAAHQPKDFYIDTRVSKRPYPVKAIYQAVKVLTAYAETLGLNPHDMPKMPNFHNCGIF
jgi:hypothetical protein